MRKINKIMMITVSILLSLVLITSSAVSSTFAKYATTGQSSSTARVAKWGVVIEADYSAISSVQGVTCEEINGGMEVSLGGLKMGPGDDLSKAIKFTVSGEAEVKLMVKISADVTFNVDEINNFNVPAGVAGLEAETTVIPFGFRFGALKADGNDAILAQYVGDPCMSNNVKSTIAENIAEITDMVYDNNSPTYAYKIFDPTDNIVLHPEGSNNIDINTFYLGFAWPSEYDFNGSKSNYSEVVNWLLENKDPTFEIKYIVTIEQIDS